MPLFPSSCLRRTAAVSAALVLATALPASAGETVHLFVTANGTAIQGESAQTSLGRAGSIECFLFRTGLRSPSGGQVQGGAMTCRKRVDKASPLLIKALVENQVVELTAKYFRPSPTGDGTTEQYYTLTGRLGRVTGIKQFTPDTLQAASAGLPDLEEVTFEFAAITFTYTNGGITAGWEATR